jgi:hypothetical protein
VSRWETRRFGRKRDPRKVVADRVSPPPQPHLSWRRSCHSIFQLQLKGLAPLNSTKTETILFSASREPWPGLSSPSFPEKFAT